MLVVVTERVPIMAVFGKWQIPLMNWGIRILDWAHMMQILKKLEIDNACLL